MSRKDILTLTLSSIVPELALKEKHNEGHRWWLHIWQFIGLFSARICRVGEGQGIYLDLPRHPMFHLLCHFWPAWHREIKGHPIHVCGDLKGSVLQRHLWPRSLIPIEGWKWDSTFQENSWHQSHRVSHSDFNVPFPAMTCDNGKKMGSVPERKEHVFNQGCWVGRNLERAG